MNIKAFPLNFDDGSAQTGMNLRDYFAAAALVHRSTQMLMPEDVARNAYKIADAMMEARK